MNGVEWVRGRSGWALKFDGAKTHVTCKPANLPATHAPQSISWWHNYASHPPRPEVIIALSDNVPSAAVAAGCKQGKVAVWQFGGNVLVSARPPTLNAWHHFAYGFDGKRHTLHVDGKLEDSSVVPPQSGVIAMCEFGRWWHGDAEQFSGLLDDVRIYNRALSDSEILGLATGNE
jgi:hypothetical protein